MELGSAEVVVLVDLELVQRCQLQQEPNTQLRLGLVGQEHLTEIAQALVVQIQFFLVLRLMVVGVVVR